MSTFAPDYHDQPRGARVAYVVAELRRLDAAGEPILRGVLSCGDTDAIDVAMSVIHGGVDQEGEDVISPRLWRLRLTEGAVPPARDPQGRKLPAAKAGKCLLAKVGNKGGRIPIGLGGGDLAKFADSHSGARRAIKAHQGTDLYDLVEITREPRVVTLSHAVVILRAWGVGINDQYRLERDKEGNHIPGQCNWLVEEVSESEFARIRDVTTSDARGRKAA